MATDDIIKRIMAECKFNFSLKQEQITIINCICGGEDVFGLLPTGFGFTLTKKHTAIVVSPLKALMKDQVAFLNEHKVPAAAIMEDTSFKEITDMSTSGISVLFTSPEAAVLPKWRQLWKSTFQESGCVLVFDEAHCISSWGQDFRPSYREVPMLQSFFQVPNLALTATCTRKIQQDIYNVLNFEAEKTKVVSALPDRPNIFLDITASTENYEEELSWLLERLNSDKLDKKIIIYVRSINKCYNIYLWVMTNLMDKGFVGEPSAESRRVEMFHANTDPDTKERVIKEFTKVGGSIEVLISTVAFGMGVNIPNIDMVIHWGLPSSPLEYWQEVGRCARDSRRGYAICYAFKRSISKSDEEIKKIAKSENCIRCAILENFLFEGMDEATLELIRPTEVCMAKCDSCDCTKCLCCIRCQQSCLCWKREIQD